MTKHLALNQETYTIILYLIANRIIIKEAIMPTFRSPIAKFAQALIAGILLLCIITTNGPVEIQAAEAAIGTAVITINADGTINPPTAPVLISGNTYKLQQDVNLGYTDETCLRIEKSNIVFDGQGHSFTGYNNAIGIELGTSDILPHGVTITNTVITKFQKGIYIYGSSNTISDNTVTNCINHGIYVETTSTSNIISKNTITKTSNQGIHISSSSTSNTISSNNIAYNQWGLSVSSSSNIISQNTIQYNNEGLLIGSNNNNIFSNIINNNNRSGLFISSTNSILKNNVMTDNGYNFGSTGAINDVDASNKVNGKPVYYLINEQNLIVPVDAGYVGLINCKEIKVQNLTLRNNGQGVLLISCTNISISGNAFSKNSEGIRMSLSNYCNVSANNITGNSLAMYVSYNNNHDSFSANNIIENQNGIYFDSNNHNTITLNNIVNNTSYDMSIHFSSYNDIAANYIANSDLGIIAGSLTFNNISRNTVINNQRGIYLSRCSNNTLAENNIINNTQQVIIYLPYQKLSNTWDNGTGGNYWSDYKGSDTNGDGIGDTPVTISEATDVDHYPLMGQFNISSLDLQLPVWDETMLQYETTQNPTPTLTPAPTSTQTTATQTSERSEAPSEVVPELTAIIAITALMLLVMPAILLKRIKKVH